MFEPRRNYSEAERFTQSLDVFLQQESSVKLKRLVWSIQTFTPPDDRQKPDRFLNIASNRGMVSLGDNRVRKVYDVVALDEESGFYYDM